ncbi:phage portal protein [Iamia majanohamensis]|uniref:Phage portal protein n=1 Tax=Iamia majanohamensis TaxID=467976 RepID=A0AAF0BUJ3_9ACTN|nr:phage portal protein [Iamia majanohamensis]WCO67882.1 phage portal protein [Iamia majanohamensis]
MSLLRNALGIEQRSVPDIPDGYGQPGAGWWGGGMVWNPATSSVVTNDRAMRLSAVFACLRLISEAISTLPLDTYVRNGGTRRPYRPRPDYLGFEPPQSSRVDYLSQLLLSLLTDGNAYVLTPRDRMGVPVDLFVLNPESVTVERKRGRVTYRVFDQEVTDRDLMHIKGMTLPGELEGMSPIGYARETIGIGLAAQDYGRAMMENGATPSMAIKVPPGPDGGLGSSAKERAQKIAETWNATHRGPKNAGKVGVLLGGAEPVPFSINPDDAQYLETRQFQVPDIARIFGVPPHLIADASNSTSWGSGLAEQNLAFGQFSLRPWLERIETAHTRLLSTHGLTDVFIKLNLDALLRASLKDRYDSYAVGINSGFLSANDARSLEDMPPVPNGDQYVNVPAGAQGAANQPPPGGAQ